MENNANDTSLPSVLERAVTVAGTADWGDRDFTDTLELFWTSCLTTGALNQRGRRVLAKVILRHLVNRLHLQAHLASRPDVGHRDIHGGIVVTGLPRTGTTLLHNLLALDPSRRVLRLWEALHPVPYDGGPAGFSEASLVAEAEAWLGRFHEMVPAMRVIHPLRARGPEECDALLQNSFSSQHFDDMFNAEEYSAWLSTAALRREYGYYALQLRTLSRDDRPWVLKSPSHLGHLDALSEHVPDALIVHCHRHPTEAVASHASLVLAVRTPHSDDVSPTVVGQQSLSRCATAMARALSFRDREAHDRFVDVSYEVLVDDPIRVVDAIYARRGWEMTHGVRAAMERWTAENPRHKHGVHRYDPDQFGLSKASVTAAFDSYLDRFSELVEPPASTADG